MVVIIYCSIGYKDKATFVTGRLTALRSCGQKGRIKNRRKKSGEKKVEKKTAEKKKDKQKEKLYAKLPFPLITAISM